MEVETLQKYVGSWNQKVFGISKKRALPIARHIRKETKELIESIKKQETESIKHEAADCFILLLALAHVLHFNLGFAMIRKMQLNEGRTWKRPNKFGVIEHVRK